MKVLTAAAIAKRLRSDPPANVAEWRRLRREWSRELQSEPPRAVIKLCIGLVDAGLWGQLTSYEIIACSPAAILALTPASVRALASGISGWSAVDSFACYVTGPAWREGRIPTAMIHRWLKSPDRWLRRTAVVSTVALNVPARGGSGDTARTLDVCRRVLADRDDMVVKAVSWSLRSLVQWDRAAVASFLVDHDDELAARIKREVGTKLRTGRKN
jgi:3-methyladenine DNA glycosylase AlkD